MDVVGRLWRLVPALKDRDVQAPDSQPALADPLSISQANTLSDW